MLRADGEAGADRGGAPRHSRSPGGRCRLARDQGYGALITSSDNDIRHPCVRALGLFPCTRSAGVALADQIRKYWKNFIGGDWVDADDAGRIPVLDPATGEVICEVARGGAADIDRAVAAARQAFASRVLLEMTPAARGELMFEIARQLESLADEIALVEMRDNGKTLQNGYKEVALTQRYLHYYGGLADKLEGRQILLGDGIVDYTVHMPYGVSAQIVPWNGPLPVGARSVACALITGNTVVLKSPEDSPLSLFLFAEACERAGV